MSDEIRCDSPMTPEQIADEIAILKRMVRQFGLEIHAWRRWHRNFRVHELVSDDDLTGCDYVNVWHERGKSESLCVALRRFPFKFYREDEP